MLVFFDDILIYSSDMETHYRHLSMVLNLLHENQLFANRKKYVFGQTQISYLGHMITGQEVEAEQDKVVAMIHWRFHEL